MSRTARMGMRFSFFFVFSVVDFFCGVVVVGFG
jgi:hypothetical protein